MRHVVKYAGMAVLAAMVFVAVLWSISRLQDPSDEQRVALELLRQPPTSQGGNAFPALWLLGYQVPVAQLQDVTYADMARLAAMSPDKIRTAAARIPAAGRFADLAPTPADMALFCDSSEASCLDKVRRDPAAYAGLIERNKVLLDRVVALSQYDHYRSGLQRMAAPLPDFNLARLQVTRVAQRFVDGQVDRALADACRGVATWRRLGANSDSLLIRMVGDAYATDGYASLFAEMLAELPATHPLPASCSQAFAEPEPDEVSVCRQMRGEFASVANGYRSQWQAGRSEPGVAERLKRSIFMDTEMTIAMQAPALAQSCAPDAYAALAAGKTVDPYRPRLSPWRLECVANAIGCVLNGISVPSYADYQQRARDHAARLTLMATLLSLRADSGNAPLADRLQARWARTRSADHVVRVVDDGQAVAVAQPGYGPPRDWWQVPLPASALSPGK